MQLPRLYKGKLIRRYKRFLAEVQLESAQTVTAYCPNTGSMSGCSDPGSTVYLSHHPKQSRKLKYTWEITQTPDSLVGINTQLTNKIVQEGFELGTIPEFKNYDKLTPEVKTGDKTRIDFVLYSPSHASLFLEVKNCTLVENQIAYFPDAVTSRGQKHLKKLSELRYSGYTSAVLFLVQRNDAQYFKPAAQIDPQYSQYLAQAKNNGVQVLVYDVDINTKNIGINKSLNKID